MCRHNYLIVIAPHTLGGFDTDTVRFLRRNLACLKALITVIRYVSTKFTETPLCGHHLFVGSFLRAVDSADIHRLVCLVAVLNVIESGS